MNESYDDDFPRGEAAPRRESTLSATLDQLYKQLAELQDAIDSLVIRVEHVTQPSVPRNEVAVKRSDDEPMLDRPVSPAIHRLYELRSTINRMSMQVRDVTDRLDT